jgi:hypothetical protein
VTFAPGILKSQPNIVRTPASGLSMGYGLAIGFHLAAHVCFRADAEVAWRTVISHLVDVDPYRPFAARLRCSAAVAACELS